MNTTANKVVNADKRLDIAADKKLNIVANKTVNTDKKQNAVAEQSILIKDQIISWTKLGS